MSHSVNVSPEVRAKDAAFLQERAASGKEKYIVRHSKQARLTHGITVIACILLAISGLFVFVPQLAQAVDAGCFFSVSARMLETKRGREYAKAIPLRKLLLETDAPAVIDPEREHPSVLYSYDQMRLQLVETLKRLARIRGIGESELAVIVQQNAFEVFC